MRATKWIFFAYLMLVGLLLTGLAFSFKAAPQTRDTETLYCVYSGTIKSLDPPAVFDSIGSELVGQIHECLYNYRYDPNVNEIFPEIAAAMPQTSPDQTLMTIKLRPGIYFYDPEKIVWPDGKGPEVKAADVIFSFKRIADFHLASPNYSAIFQGVIAGVDKWWDYTQHTEEDQIDWDKPVEGFQVLDDYTVRLKFTRPNPQMIYHLADVPTGIVSRQAVKRWGETYQHHPIGTGPYALAENHPEQRLVMTANPLYRGRPDLDGTTPLSAFDPNRMPHIKRIEYEYFVEELPVFLLFKQGKLDIDTIPKDAYRQAIGDSGDLTPEMTARGVRVIKRPEATTEYIGFNMQDPTLGRNKPLRQAMSMAFDRASYIRNFHNGRAVTAIGPIPPGFPTFDPNRINPYTQYNLARARELMKEAERINGGPIPKMSLLMRSSDTLSRQSAENIVSQMSLIGVPLEPTYREFARWQQMVDNRQTQIFDSAWGADYPDEQDYYQLFYSKNAPDSGVNMTVYSNPVFDALYEKASVLPDSPERRRLYMEMDQIVTEDCPWLLVCYRVMYRLHYDWVTGLLQRDYGHGDREYLTLDGILRQNRLGG